MEILIRPGKKEDLETVLELIKELAVFEQAPHEVEVSLTELENDFENNVFDFYCAEVNNQVVGMCLYYIKYSTWKGRSIYLDDIIINERFRGKGIGTMLFNKLVQHAKDLKVRKLEWMVLNWNESAIGFYEKFPTVFDNEWILCKLTEKEINRL